MASSTATHLGCHERCCGTAWNGSRRNVEATFSAHLLRQKRPEKDLQSVNVMIEFKKEMCESESMVMVSLLFAYFYVVSKWNRFVALSIFI
mmetsp:Transcript_72961/g.84650  ORF Transcript_72961/g.84650 Transcript_72961/m.84650 type:complete len:91 (-) Transcript_72961:30-302(-)